LDDVDLSVMATEVMEELRLREPQRPVQVSIAPGLRVHADARLMRIVLDNLLGNAWKYTSGKADASIALRAVERQGETAFCIADNGVGFDMARAGKLFHAFQRLHAESGIEGHGIGLVTAQRIIHRHGGRIWAEAEAGRGARFFFTLTL
jgi:light-regulated signal transduction histidine kinase (bacteriophytochrome)